MRILIVYGTTEGQTRRIATFAADRLSGQRHQVSLRDSAEPSGSLSIGDFDAAIIAASLHAGSYQKSVRRFVQGNLAVLRNLPAAYISMSLAAAGKDPGDWSGLEKCVDSFAAATGWTPPRVHHAAGALRYSRYNPLVRWFMKMMARRRGAGGSADREFTDWEALGEFLDDFVSETAGADEPAPAEVAG